MLKLFKNMTTKLTFLLYAVSLGICLEEPFLATYDTAQVNGTTSMPFPTSSPESAASERAINFGVQTSVSFPKGGIQHSVKRTCNCEIIGYQAEILDLKMQLVNWSVAAAINDCNAKLGESNSKIENRLTELENENAQLKELLLMRSDSESSLDVLKENITLLPKQFDAVIKETISKFEKRLLALEKNIADLKTKDIANLISGIKSTEASVASLRSSTAKVERDVTRATNAVGEVNAKVQTTSNTLSDLTSSLDSLKLRVVTDVGFTVDWEAQLWRGPGSPDLLGRVITGIWNHDKDAFPDRISIRRMKVKRNGGWRDIYLTDV